jgi:hypothetical protein
MAATFYPEGSEEGLAEVRRRIAEAKRKAAEELDIGGVGLTEVPEELFALGQIKALYLGLPKAAAETPYNLRTEEDRKSHNAVSALPPALFASLPHLTKLHLEHNRLTVLPDTIGRATRLTVLDLGGGWVGDNKIGDEGAQVLGPLVNLTSLNLPGNAIGADDAQALGQLVNLTHYAGGSMRS